LLPAERRWLESVAPAVKAHYRTIGANHTSVWLAPTHELDATLDRVLEAMPFFDESLRFPGPLSTQNDTDLWNAWIPKWSLRWAPHGRMLLMRYKAFQMALQTGHDYAWHLYVREDNAFVPQPASLPAVASFLARDAPPRASALVAVDNLCGSEERTRAREWRGLEWLPGTAW